MKKYDRSEHLKRLHENRRDATRQKAEAAILRLVKSHKAVNFNSVAKESGLAKATLYNNLDIRDGIERLRTQQSQLPTPAAMKRDMGEQSKDAVIALLKRKINQLTAEDKQLVKQLKMSYAEYYQKL